MLRRGRSIYRSVARGRPLMLARLEISASRRAREIVELESPYVTNGVAGSEVTPWRVPLTSHRGAVRPPRRNRGELVTP